MSTQNQNDKKDETKKREPYRINFTERPTLDFVGKQGFISSIKLGSIIGEVFGHAFADFEGCRFEPGQNGEPTYSLLFNHNSYDAKAVVGVSRNESASTNSRTIDRLRAIDRNNRDGDKYYPTEDLKDIVIGLLTSRAFNNGKPNWGQIVTEYVDRNMSNYYNMQHQPQYTKVNFIDISRLVKLLFGNKDNEGNKVEYIVSIAAPLTPPGYQQMLGQHPNNYMLSISQINANNIAKLYEELGFGSIGSDIIRN